MESSNSTMPVSMPLDPSTVDSLFDCLEGSRRALTIATWRLHNPTWNPHWSSSLRVRIRDFMWEISFRLWNPPPPGEIWHDVPRRGRVAFLDQEAHSAMESIFFPNHFEEMAREQPAPDSLVPTTTTMPDVTGSPVDSIPIPTSEDEREIDEACRIFERAQDAIDAAFGGPPLEQPASDFKYAGMYDLKWRWLIHRGPHNKSGGRR